MTNTKIDRIYLAARFERQAEMRERAAELRALGFTVTSRWITEERTDDNLGAISCLNDVIGSDAICLFTDPYSETRVTGGGKDVEFGVAIAARLDLFVVGPRRNVFQHLEGVEQFDTWEAFVSEMELRR